MSNANFEQFAAAGQANLNAMVELSQAAFANVEKLAGLNLEAARTVLDDSAAVAKAALSAKDPQELLGLVQASVNTEKATAYGRQVQDIVSASQADLTKLVEAQIADAQSKLQALVETAAKNAPAGGENMVALFKQAVSASNAAYESAQKAAQQAVKTTEANVQAMTANMTKAAETAAQNVTKATRKAK